MGARVAGLTDMKPQSDRAAPGDLVTPKSPCFVFPTAEPWTDTLGTFIIRPEDWCLVVATCMHSGFESKQGGDASSPLLMVITPSKGMGWVYAHDMTSVCPVVP